MQHLKTILIALSVISAVSAAPAPAIASKDVLLQNGKDAQQLNSVFRSLDVTAPCDTGDFACVDNDMSICTAEGVWKPTRRGKCDQGDSCFAVPDTKDAAVNLMCTTEANALLLFESTGVTGGIFGDDSGSSTTTSGTATRTSSTVSSTSTSAPSVTTVTTTVAPSTVTVTEVPGQTTVTATISPSEASEILSSASPTASSSSVSASTTSASSSSATTASSSTITLTPSSSIEVPFSTPSAPPSSSTSTSTSSSASPSPSATAAVTTILLTTAPSSTQASTSASSAIPSAPAGLGGGFGGYSGGYRRSLNRRWYLRREDVYATFLPKLIRGVLTSRSYVWKTSIENSRPRRAPILPAAYQSNLGALKTIDFPAIQLYIVGHLMIYWVKIAFW
ncbi:hypothetical protein FA13DRAFT_1710843 [Coprinellus micaceus]|uniref:Carbohydrate-binding module family 19 domain-containing protein n=1 Tax=Coprinellus micaceus TaxID=71717 RepID=A0A4Y7T780_COPMI|nr:hypothetical protein FA13DRAFT_1710843 [Coprinellus micaceus]